MFFFCSKFQLTKNSYWLRMPKDPFKSNFSFLTWLIFFVKWNEMKWNPPRRPHTLFIWMERDIFQIQWKILMNSKKTISHTNDIKISEDEVSFSREPIMLGRWNWNTKILLSFVWVIFFRIRKIFSLNWIEKKSHSVQIKGRGDLRGGFHFISRKTNHVRKLTFDLCGCFGILNQ